MGRAEKTISRQGAEAQRRRPFRTSAVPRFARRSVHSQRPAGGRATADVRRRGASRSSPRASLQGDTIGVYRCSAWICLCAFAPPREFVRAKW